MRVEERRYYARRAREYDDWYLGRGHFADRDRPGWEEEMRGLLDLLASLPMGRVLDAACGTGFLTRHLRGEVTGIDQSAEMIEIARLRCPDADFVVGDALALRFADGSFDLVLAAHFYGHLREPDRQGFLVEARRVAPALVVVDSALRPGVEREAIEERFLNDGSRYEVYKRFFEPTALARELGGGEVLFAGSWYVAVAA